MEELWLPKANEGKTASIKTNLNSLEKEVAGDGISTDMAEAFFKPERGDLPVRTETEQFIIKKLDNLDKQNSEILLSLASLNSALDILISQDDDLISAEVRESKTNIKDIEAYNKESNANIQDSNASIDESETSTNEFGNRIDWR